MVSVARHVARTGREKMQNFGVKVSENIHFKKKTSKRGEDKRRMNFRKVYMFVLLHYDSTLMGFGFLTFRDKVLVSYSRVLMSKKDLCLSFVLDI